MDMWKRVANGSEKESKEILVRYKQGAPFVWTKAVLRTIYTENGVPLRAVGILEDISLQKAAELAFIKEEKYRQAMLAETLASAEINLTKDVIEKTSGIWVRRKRTKNMTYSEILNLVSEVEIYKEDQKKHFAAVNRDALLKNYQQGQTEIKCEYRRVSLDGEVVWVRLTTHLIKEPDSGDIKALVYLRDIDREKRSELTMKYRSERDSLTGLYNKGTAEQKTRLFLESEKRENARHAFIIMDLDHFKIMNDTYGHQYGDEVLKSTASILKDTFRSDDIEGRLGGDEMAVLMKNIPYKGCVEEKLEILKERLLEISREKTPVTVSIGVSFFREHGADYEELYRTADLALYEAKERGRNQFVIYDAGLEK